MITTTPCPDCGELRSAKESKSYYVEWLECPACGNRSTPRPIALDERA